MKIFAIFQKRRKLASFIFVLLVLLLLISSFHTYLGRVWGYVQSPFVQAGTWVSTHTGMIFDRGECSPNRLASLEQQRAALAVDLAELATLRQENELLRKQLAFVQRQHLEVKTAAVTSRSSSKRSTKMTINLGEADGLRTGMPVIVGDGNLVGKISHLNQYSATVTGLTDLNTATAVSLLNSNRTIGIAKGTIGELLDLDFIPHDEKIMVGDLVVTSGLEEEIPSGLIVGIVTAVDDDQNTPFQKAVIEPLVNITDFSLVSVIFQNP